MDHVFHLYIHLPFCARRCDYCDFFSTEGKLAQTPAYVEAVLAELGEFTGDARVAVEGSGLVAPSSLRTLYLGGGTPTLIGAAALGRLLDGLRPWLAEGCEVTVEANPATVTRELAEALAAGGVNRVSLGAQSFNPRLREALGRRGPTMAIGRAFGFLREAGLKNIALDLIFGIPGQSLVDLREDLSQALALEPRHVSCYELTVQPDSVYEHKWAAGLETARAQGRLFYETAVDILEGAGYRWYETSNFALPGRECAHNLAYWAGEDYLGLGAGAWSTVGMRRWRNGQNVEAYVAAARISAFDELKQKEQLAPAQKLTEKLVLGLRRAEGVELAEVEDAVDPDQMSAMARGGFLKAGRGRLALTPAGRFVANEVCVRIMAPEGYTIVPKSGRPVARPGNPVGAQAAGKMPREW